MNLIPHDRGGMLRRFALGAVIVILFTASATAVAGLLQFKQFASDLSLSPTIDNAQVTIPDPGNPQTLLLIGSDHRAGTPFSSANTDTMMLARLDPNSATINLLSIPRDLRVTIPTANGPSVQKLNAAYSVGGPNLLIRILQGQVFPGLYINHIIDVNFGGFEALVNSIGCVYTDVDHRYYNDTAVTNYSSINIQPGYQKLCGPDALAFVRFRHTDSDIVRNARQQDFLRWAKDGYSSSQLVANRDTLIKIFGQHTETDPDLHSVDGLINLFNLVAFSAGHTIKQIPFPAILLPCNPQPNVQTPCFVGASRVAEARAFDQFMTPTVSAAPSSGSGGGGGRAGGGSAGGGGGGGSASLTDDTADGRGQAAQIRASGLPVFYPRMIDSNSRYCTNATCTIGPVADSYPRSYTIHDQEGSPHVAYRMTLVMNPLLGQYYGVEGTTWQDPPLLTKPTQTRTVAGKQLMLFSNGHKLSVVAWRTPQGVYWISNTLTDTLSPSQMVGIAASLTRAP